MILCKIDQLPDDGRWLAVIADIHKKVPLSQGGTDDFMLILDIFVDEDRKIVEKWAGEWPEKHEWPMCPCGWALVEAAPESIINLAKEDPETLVEKIKANEIPRTSKICHNPNCQWRDEIKSAMHGTEQN